MPAKAAGYDDQKGASIEQKNNTCLSSWFIPLRQNGTRVMQTFSSLVEGFDTITAVQIFVS